MTVLKKKIKIGNARKIKFKQKNLINIKTVQVLFSTLRRKKKKNVANIFYSQGNRECAHRMVNSISVTTRRYCLRE